MAFAVLGLCAGILGMERSWRLRGEPISLTQRAIIVALFAIGVGALAYGTADRTEHFYNIGRLAWHCSAVVILGALEVLIATLRSEIVSSRATRRIVARSSFVVTLILVAWPLGTAHEASIGVSKFSEHDFASAVTLLVFPAYTIWALCQVIALSIYRFPRDIKRRPINTIALFLIALGCGGFIWTNATSAIYMNTGRASESEGALALSPLSLGICVAGATMLGVGERLYDELMSRYQLTLLGPLWRRMIELSDQDFHLPVQSFSAPARLQRAYVEIADAICTVRVVVDGNYDPDSIVSALRRGDVTTDSSYPTLSRTLPPRRSRREDLQLITVLAATYRRSARATRRLTAAQH